MDQGNNIHDKRGYSPERHKEIIKSPFCENYKVRDEENTDNQKHERMRDLKRGIVHVQRERFERLFGLTSG